MSFLGRHPFPVLAHFDRVVALSFAFPEAVLRPLVPETLEIDTHEGLGFVTVALVWTRHLRPAGLPPCMGHSFFLAGYRIFTRLRDSSGRRLRGLRILRSETDKRLMVWLGNIMTGYHYRRVKLALVHSGSQWQVRAALPNGCPTLDLHFDMDARPESPPQGSPFTDWRTARLFAGPMPFTFSPEQDGSIIVIEGTRSDWSPRPILVTDWKISLFEEAPFRGMQPILANAFAVDNVAYRWERGRVVIPGGAA